MRTKFLLQTFLKEKGLQAVVDQLHVDVKRHQTYPNLCLLKYNQIESPMDNPVVQQCRGIILDEADDWRVVARPYDKFFNLGEGNAAQLDWSTAKVYEKVDGSLMTLYWYKDEWHVATSGTPDAMGLCNSDPKQRTFKQLFWDTWKELGYHLPIVHELCYMFELMTPSNKVVVQHSKPRIVHHGARFINGDMEEMWPDAGDVFGWEITTPALLEFDKDSIQGIADQEGPGTEHEGFVLVDHLFRRVKVKNKDYLRLHRMIDGMSQRKMLDIIRTNEGSEFLTYFPEWKDLYAKVKDEYDWVVKKHQATYDSVKLITDQKTFALEIIRQSTHTGALFAVRSGKAKSFQEYFANCNIKTLEQLLGIKEDNGKIESGNCS